MKKSTNPKYMEISNKTKSCIVINSCNIILKPKGESGDSVIVDESKTMDNDVVGLNSSDLIEISLPKTKKIKKQENDDLVKEKKQKKSKVSVNDKKGSKVIYIDHGKVKKGRMSRSIQDLHMIDAKGEEKPQNAVEDDDKPSDAFVDL